MEGMVLMNRLSVLHTSCFVLLGSSIFAVSTIMAEGLTLSSSLLDLLLSFSSSFIIILCISIIEDAQKSKVLEEAFVNCLRSTIFYNSNGTPLAHALELSLTPSTPNPIKSEIRRTASRIQLGIDKPELFISPNLLKFCNTFKVSPGRVTDVGGLGALLEAHDLHLNEQLSYIESSIQKFATANMFLAVIAPSFILFAFIGNSIISQGQSDLRLLYVLLLGVIPALYALSSLLFSRRINA